MSFDPANNPSILGDHEFWHDAANPAIESGFTLVGGCPDCNPRKTGTIVVRPNFNFTTSNILLDCGSGDCDLNLGGQVSFSNYVTRPERNEGK